MLIPVDILFNYAVLIKFYMYSIEDEILTHINFYPSTHLLYLRVEVFFYLVNNKILFVLSLINFGFENADMRPGSRRYLLKLFRRLGVVFLSVSTFTFQYSGLTKFLSYFFFLLNPKKLQKIHYGVLHP